MTTSEYRAIVSNWLGKERSERDLGVFASADLAKEFCQRRSGRWLKWEQDPRNPDEWWSEQVQYQPFFHVVPVIVSEPTNA